jgi:predicted dienelactone hydrolase
MYFEIFIPEKQVIRDLLKEDSGASTQLDAYRRQCEDEADLEAQLYADIPGSANRANIKCAIRMARVYAKVPRLKTAALEELESVRLAASQSDDTRDLLRVVDRMIFRLNHPKKWWQFWR